MTVLLSVWATCFRDHRSIVSFKQFYYGGSGEQNREHHHFPFSFDALNPTTVARGFYSWINRRLVGLIKDVNGVDAYRAPATRADETALQVRRLVTWQAVKSISVSWAILIFLLLCISTGTSHCYAGMCQLYDRFDRPSAGLDYGIEKSCAAPSCMHMFIAVRLCPEGRLVLQLDSLSTSDVPERSIACVLGRQLNLNQHGWV